MPCFLHTADWQIGRAYSRFMEDDAIPLAAARIDAVRSIASLAAERQVAAVLVAGDVFDAQTVADRTIRQLFLALEAYGGPWIFIPGNHDAALAESVWTRARRLAAIPSNAYVSLQPETLDFAAEGFAVLTAPLVQRHTYQDLTEWFDKAETAPGLLRLGLAHGSVQGILADGIDSPNPVDPGRADSARLDYLALGDWHGTRRIDARTWYSGTPEQDRFKANDAGNVLLVDIAAAGSEPEVTSLRVGKHAWEQWHEELRLDSDVDVLIERLEALPAAAVLDLSLAGQADLTAHHRLQQALSQAQARLRSVTVDWQGLGLWPSEAELNSLQASGYVGEVIAELRERQINSPEQQERSAAAAALTVLAGLLRDSHELAP